MIEKENKNFTQNPDVIKHYNLLKDIGVFDYIDILQREVKAKQELLKEALGIFNIHSVEELIRYLASRLLNRFIPSKLAFILQEELDPDKANIICFENLQTAECKLAITNLKPYKEYFKLSPSSTSFEVFEYLIDDKKITDIFLPLNPKIVVPMMGLEGMYGFIIFGEKILQEKYSDQEEAYIDSIMTFASISLQNIIHHRRAIYDTKTKLYNHTYFSLRFEEEFNRMQRYNYPLCILLLDLDFFKKLNDLHGHMVGDKMLIHVADLIKTCIRAGDIAARFGGEEFIVMLLGCEREQATSAAERIRTLIEKTGLEHEGKNIYTSVSIGISLASPKCCENQDRIIEQADIALYQSKTNGRNCYTIYEPDMGGKD